MTLPTDYVDGDVLTAADVNAITTAVNGTIPVATIAAKGDLLVGLTNDSVGVLSVGTNGYLLSASSGATSGLAWTPAGGKVLGFAYDTDSTDRSTTSTTPVDITGLSITYTPISATSNLIVDLYVAAEVYRTAGTPAVRKATIRLTDGSTATDAVFGRDLDVGGSSDALNSFAGVHIRRVFPSTGTSARTFKGQFSVPVTDLTVEVNNSSVGQAVISVMEVAA